MKQTCYMKSYGMKWQMKLSIKMERQQKNKLATYLYWLDKAKQIERLGFKPTIDSDVFFPIGHVPTGWYGA